MQTEDHLLRCSPPQSSLAKRESSSESDRAVLRSGMSISRSDAQAGDFDVSACSVIRSRQTGSAASTVTLPPDMRFDGGWCRVACGPTTDDDDDDNSDSSHSDDSNTLFGEYEPDKRQPRMWWQGTWDVVMEAPGRFAPDQYVFVMGRGVGTLTLRGDTPLSLGGSYRVVIIDYGQNECFTMGFIPQMATPAEGKAITEYGGWCICMAPSCRRAVIYSCGWVADGDDQTVPAVPAGSAVEFTLGDGTCHVNFYAPDAVSRSDFTSPCNQMDLRFVEREAAVFTPARSIPDPNTPLYPAVGCWKPYGAVAFV